MTDSTPEHLTPTVSDRGFSSLPAIPDTYGGEARVYESSAASAPHLWLAVTQPANYNAPGGPKTSASLHYLIEDAVKLAEQILFIAGHHYQRSGAVAADELTAIAQDMGTLDQPASAFEEPRSDSTQPPAYKTEESTDGHEYRGGFPG